MRVSTRKCVYACVGALCLCIKLLEGLLDGTEQYLQCNVGSYVRESSGIAGVSLEAINTGYGV